MKYYVIRDKDTGEFTKGKGKYGNTFRNSNAPPKLYSFGTAKQYQSFYRNWRNKELEILEAHVHLYSIIEK
jgi:hypothetical protein